MAPMPGNILDNVADSIDDAADAIGGETNQVLAIINGLCLPGQNPTLVERLDFDSDCDRMIEFTINDTTREFDALWIWGVIIGMLIGFCVCAVLCRR
jgi:hypothetical protein